jgi:hypothetical protein
MCRSANWVQHFLSFGGDGSPRSPTPILIPEEPEHPAGISHRLKSQEALNEGLIFRPLSSSGELPGAREATKQ